MGATSLPEALRVVPSLRVARIDKNKWAISSRRFTNQFSNKLLVLVDGRTVYTPLYSGVYWDAQDLVMEDVERIEGIRGPGASLWGANAVNGVINVITRSARDVEGLLVRDVVDAFAEAGIRANGASAAELPQLIHQVAVVYVTPGTQVPSLASLCEAHGLLSVSGIPELALRGDVAISIGIREQKPEILAHLRRVKAEGHELAAGLLEVAKVIR